jgi:hypothetical protein
MARETDISGTVIPTRQRGTIDRVVAVPPVRDVPNEQATEFILTGYGNLAAGGVAFVALTDPSTGNPFAARVDPKLRGRVDALLLYCPDMVAAAAPYLFAQLTLGGQLANAWGFVPIYPRNGVASLSFSTVIDLAPNVQIGLLGENTDAVNTHFLAVYLHGWYWPADLQEG